MPKSIRDGILYFDGCNVVNLANKYGTPLYLLSETKIAKKASQLKTEFLEKYERTKVAYAGKAFLTIGMCKLLQKYDLGLDVVSGGELYTAIKAKFPPGSIEFNGNNKLDSELEMAIDYGIGRIIVDSAGELERINKICIAKNSSVNVLFRITPEVDVHTHAYISTGNKGSKFGISMEDGVLYPLIKMAIDSPYLNFMGFHFHIGSQLKELDPYLKSTELLLGLVSRTKEHFGYDVKELNIGGGFSIRYLPDDPERSYAFYLDPIMEMIEKYSKDNGIQRPTVVIEPGRSLVGEAGITVYKVGDIKEVKDVCTYMSVDGGMCDNIRPALYQAEYYGVIANKMDIPATTKVTVCGKCCESSDILIRDICVPTPETDDIFVIFSTGAYGYALANNYNKNSIPPVVLLKDGKSGVMVKRQSYDNILENEIEEVNYD
jgi:diaminopimelate decarboxylase